MVSVARATQLLSAMVAKLGNMDDPLPQDSFEGVDEDEWVSLLERRGRRRRRNFCCYNDKTGNRYQVLIGVFSEG